MTAAKGFEASKKWDEQKNMQYLLHKDFAIKANTLKNRFGKGCNENNFALQKKRPSAKSFSFLLLDRFNSGIKTI